MAVLAPPETENSHAFVEVAGLLQSAGIAVPQILAVDYDQGFLLQSDLGDTLLQSVLDHSNVDDWYQKAMQQLQAMLTLDARRALPAYDANALQLELSYFCEWFVGELLGYVCSADEQKMLAVFFNHLLSNAQQQPQVFVHRDYHCRNIMVTGNGELATIDFQDAVCGPVTYDLVSLLRDCYVVWPQQKVRDWVAAYWQQMYQQNLVEVEQETFQRWFDLMGLQRHIKVLGIFARLSIRDNKHGYLQSLPTVIRYVLEVSRQHPQAQPFVNWFEVELLPLVRKQAWGQSL